MEHTFAAQLLKKRGVMIINKKSRKRLLESHSQQTLYIKNPPIMLTVGDKLIEREGNVRRISYEDMKRMGYVVISLVAKKPWFPGQKVYYTLAQKINIPASAHIKTELPSGHSVEVDTAMNRVRLCGKNASSTGSGEWVR